MPIFCVARQHGTGTHVAKLEKVVLQSLQFCSSCIVLHASQQLGEAIARSKFVAAYSYNEQQRKYQCMAAGKSSWDDS